MDLKTRMHEVSQSHLGQQYMAAYAQTRWGDDNHTVPDKLTDAVAQMTSAAWRIGEPYVLARR